METFTKLFGSLLAFVYHCFDRIVINGYLEYWRSRTVSASTSFSWAWHNARRFDPERAKYPTDDPDYRILASQRSRLTHYYFYIRDGILGPIFIRVDTFQPFHTTYYLNCYSYIEV